jgi:type I restriction enzyme M protein
VIDGVLNNVRTQYVRNYLKQQVWIKAVVSLAKETFEGYGARAKTSVLLLQKKQQPDEDGQQQPPFMAVAQNTGYALNGAPIPGNELGNMGFLIHP